MHKHSPELGSKLEMGDNSACRPSLLLSLFQIEVLLTHSAFWSDESEALPQRRALWSAENEALPQCNALWSAESKA